MKIIQFLSILTFWSSAFGICPNGTIPYGTYCYKVFNTPTWFVHAELQCVQLNGHLASVGDNSTNFNLMTIANSSITTNSSFWIGGTTLITGSKWTWSDGRDVTFTNWVKGRPLNAKNSNSISMIISNGLWYDEFYGDSLPFICEIPQDPVHRCHQNGTYIESTNSCYTIACGPVAWSDARTACMNEGGDLTSINSPWDDYFLNLIAYLSSCYPGDYPEGDDFTPMFYIGIHKLNNGTWVWTDGSNSNYANWYTACRDATTCNNNYAYAGFRDVLANAWTTLPDSGNIYQFHIGYICKTSPINTIQMTQAPPANLTQTTQNSISSVALTKQTTATKNIDCNGECPVGWYQGKNNKCFCYNFYLPSDDWFGADLICDRDAKGATLASIDGVFENYEILSMANNWVASCDLIFIDLANTGNGWAWANGDHHNYTNWAKGYPINDDSLACGAMNVTTQHGQWQNIDCSLRQCFVCKLVLSN